MGTEARIIELLYWIRDRGLIPRRPVRGDRFLCPITRRISTFQQLQPHQTRTALWIPTVQGLKDKGIHMETEDLGQLTVVKTHRYLGAGPGEAEAVLSLLNRVRIAQAA